GAERRLAAAAAAERAGHVAPLALLHEDDEQEEEANQQVQADEQVVHHKRLIIPTFAHSCQRERELRLARPREGCLAEARSAKADRTSDNMTMRKQLAKIGRASCRERA